MRSDVSMPSLTLAGAGEGDRAPLAPFDTGRAQADVATLCSDAFAGRRVGTAGHDAARGWLAEQFVTLGLQTTTFRFTLDVPVLDLYAFPTLTILDEDGRVVRALRHRRQFTAHPRSADTPAPVTGMARRADAAAPVDAELAPAPAGAGMWLILDAVPQGEALTAFAAEHAAAGVIGLLVPQLPNADGYLVKRIVGQRPVDLPVVAVRADLLAALDGQWVAASAPIRPTRPEGGHVLGLLQGSDPTLGATSPLIVSAHYDGVGDDGPPGAGRPRLPCATDNAAGVAVILEVARHLVAHAGRGKRPRRPIVFAALDAEEVNAVGSRAYASALKTRGMSPLVINLDGAARLHEAIQVEPSPGGPGADALLTALDQAGEHLEIPLAVGQVSSDNRRFAAAGFAAVGVSVGLSGLHTPADTPDRVEPEAMRRAGMLLLATIWKLTYAG